MQDCWPWKRMVHIVPLRGREEEAENKISRKLCEVKGGLGVIREISPQYVTLAHGWHNCSKSYPWAYTSAQVNTILYETLRVAEQDLSVMKLITVQWGGGRVIKKWELPLLAWAYFIYAVALVPWDSIVISAGFGRCKDKLTFTLDRLEWVFLF